MILWSFLAGFAAAASPPNIVFILSDDLGYNDVGFHGSEIRTPFLDGLVEKGIHFTNYYGHSICSPSRSALMTGRFASHVGLQHSWIHPGAAVDLPLKFKTMGDHLKEFGYGTAMVGKWHLGFTTDAHTPWNRGFDDYFGYLTGGEDYFTHEAGGFTDMHDNDQLYKTQGEYSAYLFGNRSIDVIKSRAKGSSNPDAPPLFLYIAFQSVHAPIEVPQAYEDAYAWINSTKRRKMAGMVTAMDDQIRDIVGALRDVGAWDNTLLVFAADNGGPPYVANSNFPMRGGKWTMWEGGTHLTAFAHHGSCSSGKDTECVLPPRNFTGLMHHCDWVATLTAAAGRAGPLNDTAVPAPDGVNMWSSLADASKTEGPRTSVLLNVDQTNNRPNGTENDPKDGWAGYAGIRVGKYKLVLGNPGKPDGWCWPNQPHVENKPEKMNDFFGVGASPMPDPNDVTCSHSGKVPANKTGAILFDLEADPTERKDLADAMPGVVAQLRPMLQKYIDSAVDPLNELPSERQQDPASIAAAKAAGGWVPWRNDTA